MRGVTERAWPGGVACGTMNQGSETMRRILLVTLTAVLLGCTPKDDQDRSLTQRERDSIIGESMLPGAHGVRGALRVADSAAARNERAAQIN